MDVKKIREEILSHKYNPKKLDGYVNNDFKSSIQAIINALFVLLREPNKNEKKINELLCKIDDLTNRIDDKNKLIIIYKKIDELIVRIDKHLLKKNTTEIKKVIFKLKNIVDNSKSKVKKEYVDETVKLLEKLIYEDKDLVKLGKIFNEHKNLFKNKEGKELFESLLSYYIKLDEVSSEAIYIFNVISLVLCSKNRYLLIVDRDRYIKILKKAKKTKTVELILEKFNKDYKVGLDELEKRYDINFSFSPRIEEMFNYKSPLVDCRNLMNFPSITIDEEGTSSIDDAISLYKNYDGTYTLRIDITSIPAIIPHMSYIDRQAYKRAETIYTSKGGITIYPPRIVYNIGSLLENNVRYVLSYFYRVDTNFDIIEGSFEVSSSKTFISNNLSYTQADILLKKDRDDELSQMLQKLSYISSKINNNGKSSFMNASKMIERLMILPGISIGNYFKRTGFPFIYYVQSKINDDDKKEIIGRYGFHNNGVCESIIEFIIGEDEKGIYSSELKKHEGLDVEAYAKITSPLRQYISALCEYIIYDVMINKKIDNATLYKWENIIKEAVPYVNERIKMNEMFQGEYEYLLLKNKIRKK